MELVDYDSSDNESECSNNSYITEYNAVYNMSMLEIKTILVGKANNFVEELSSEYVRYAPIDIFFGLFNRITNTYKMDLCFRE